MTVRPGPQGIVRMNSNTGLGASLKGLPAMLKPEEVPTWRVVATEPVNVRASRSLEAAKVGEKTFGQEVRGRQEGQWLALVDEPGYALLVGNVSGRPLFERVPPKAFVQVGAPAGVPPPVMYRAGSFAMPSQAQLSGSFRAGQMQVMLAAQAAAMGATVGGSSVTATPAGTPAGPPTSSRRPSFAAGPHVVRTVTGQVAGGPGTPAVVYRVPMGATMPAATGGPVPMYGLPGHPPPGAYMTWPGGAPVVPAPRIHEATIVPACEPGMAGSPIVFRPARGTAGIVDEALQTPAKASNPSGPEPDAESSPLLDADRAHAEVLNPGRQHPVTTLPTPASAPAPAPRAAHLALLRRPPRCFDGCAIS